MKTPEINVETLKEALKKLSFLKNNMGLMIPIVIVIVAALLFIPTRILQARLQSRIEQESLQTGRSLERLIPRVREASEAAAQAEYMNRIESDANQIELLVRQATLRELLSYDIFPDTNETSILLFEQFGQRYISGIEAMLDRLQGGRPPTEAEIEQALESAPRQGRYQRRADIDPMGTGGFGSQYMMPMERKIVDKICEDKALGARLYASPVDFDGYTFWKEWTFEERDQAYRDCWYWQLGYWVLEDITETIDAMNRDAETILDAPVKRLMNADFTMKQRLVPGRARRAVRRDEDAQGPRYVLNAREGMTTPCTGRVTDETIDVIHFNVRVVVRAEDVLPFIRELCSAKTHTFRGWFADQPEQTYEHNQITVLESGIEPVDRQWYEHAVYRYGDDAVVELNLICEYIFDQVAYEPVIPEQVKQDLLGEETE